VSFDRYGSVDKLCSVDIGGGRPPERVSNCTAAAAAAVAAAVARHQSISI